MQASKLIALLQEVPGDTVVRITTSDRDGFMYGREYTASPLYSAPGADVPTSFSIDIEFNEQFDKSDLCEESEGDSDSPGVDMGPMTPIEVRPPFKSDALEYEEYRYLEGHRPNSVWNERQLVEGIHVDPTLPDGFDCYPNEVRPFQERADWWGLPFIVSNVFVNEGKVKTGFTVRVLDGGAWDRSTNRGSFDDVETALSVAKSLL